MTVFPEGPAASPGFLLWHVTLRWQRLITDELRPLNLTHVQFVLLASSWWLGRADGPPNQLAVAAHANTNIKMTSEILRKLEDKGLIEQTTDPDDRRAKLVRVTSAGADLAARAIAVVEKADLAFFGSTSSTLVPILQDLAALDSR